MDSIKLYSQWHIAPTQRQLLKPLKKIMAKVPPLRSRSNKPLAMNTEELINILTYYHLQEFTSLTELIQALQEDDYARQFIDLWESEYQAVVKKGRQVFTDPALGINGVVCAQCHPNATNTHTETYPKFQKQIGRVVTLGEMINFCIRTPLEGKDLALDDPKMVAMQAYIAQEHRDVKLAPGKH